MSADVTAAAETVLRALRYWDLDSPATDREVQRGKTFEARAALDVLVQRLAALEAARDEARHWQAEAEGALTGFISSAETEIGRLRDANRGLSREVDVAARRLAAAEQDAANWKASCARYLAARQAAEQDNERLREENGWAKAERERRLVDEWTTKAANERERAERAEARVVELERALEREFETMGLALAAFAPHGGDSTRTGDYWAAEQVRASLDRARAVLGSVPHHEELPAGIRPLELKDSGKRLTGGPHHEEQS